MYSLFNLPNFDLRRNYVQYRYPVDYYKIIIIRRTEVTYFVGECMVMACTVQRGLRLLNRSNTTCAITLTLNGELQ